MYTEHKTMEDVQLSLWTLWDPENADWHADSFWVNGWSYSKHLAQYLVFIKVSELEQWVSSVSLMLKVENLQNRQAEDWENQSQCVCLLKSFCIRINM